jgi:hypothetical protein
LLHTFDIFEDRLQQATRKTRSGPGATTGCLGNSQGHCEELDAYCAKIRTNYHIHRGFFEQSIDAAFLYPLRSEAALPHWYGSSALENAVLKATTGLQSKPNRSGIFPIREPVSLCQVGHRRSEISLTGF